jgi:hypothetical protein
MSFQLSQSLGFIQGIADASLIQNVVVNATFNDYGINQGVLGGFVGSIYYLTQLTIDNCSFVGTLYVNTTSM